MTLKDLIESYKDALDEKERLADLQKENSAKLEQLKADITQEMIDEDVTRISLGGYTYTLTPKTAYSKRSEAELLAYGLDFFGTLRDEGLGDLIVETVNTRTLQSAMKNYVAENGELSEALEQVINHYDYNDITRRKDAVRKS